MVFAEPLDVPDSVPVNRKTLDVDRFEDTAIDYSADRYDAHDSEPGQLQIRCLLCQC